MSDTDRRSYIEYRAKQLAHGRRTAQQQYHYKVCKDCGREYFTLDEFIGHRIMLHNAVRDMLLRLSRTR